MRLMERAGSSCDAVVLRSLFGAHDLCGSRISEEARIRRGRRHGWLSAAGQLGREQVVV